MPEQKLILRNAPTHRDRFVFIERQDGFHVAEIDNDEGVIRIARDLVHRYNVHEQLVAACEAVLDELEQRGIDTGSGGALSDLRDELHAAAQQPEYNP